MIKEFDFSIDLLKVILWQYNDAEKLQKLLEQKQQWFNDNQTSYWNNWVRDVFDLRTANDFGLSVWSIILNMPIIAEAGKSDSDAPAFGFEDNYQNFENGNFFSLISTQIKLTTKQKRLILQLRYFQLVSNGTIPEINQFLKSLFGEAYVFDSYDMNYAVYVFTDEVDSDIQFIIDQFDLLPRPAGVGTAIIYRRDDLFGFEDNYQNFENGVLADFNSFKPI